MAKKKSNAAPAELAPLVMQVMKSEGLTDAAGKEIKYTAIPTLAGHCDLDALTVGMKFPGSPLLPGLLPDSVELTCDYLDTVGGHRAAGFIVTFLGAELGKAEFSSDRGWVWL